MQTYFGTTKTGTLLVLDLPKELSDDKFITDMCVGEKLIKLTGQKINNCYRLIPLDIREQPLVMLSITRDNTEYTGVFVSIVPYDCSHVVFELEKFSTCYGCKYDAPGQLDHMLPGGCLYEKVDMIKSKW